MNNNLELDDNLDLIDPINLDNSFDVNKFCIDVLVYVSDLFETDELNKIFQDFEFPKSYDKYISEQLLIYNKNINKPILKIDIPIESSNELSSKEESNEYVFDETNEHYTSLHYYLLKCF